MKKLFSLFTVLAALICAPAFAQSTSIWGPTFVPNTLQVSSGSNYELGTRFFSDIPGYVIAIRFYKASGDSATHVVTLWQVTGGTQLAQATSTSETTSGWQTVPLASPVFINPGSTYIVSRRVNSGSPYWYTNPYFVGQVDSPPLHAPANGAAYNGVTGAFGVFPNTTANNTSFFTDVMFIPGYCGIFQ
jgi:hypothetical protein